MSELQLHADILRFLSLALPTDSVYHHSPNEGKRGWSAQAALKKLGTRKGWPDIEILYQGRAYFLEVKTPGAGRLQESQRLCHGHLMAAGCPVAVVRGLDDTERALRSWGFPLRATTGRAA